MAAGIADERASDSVYVVSSASVSVWHNWLSWTYAGVDPKLPGNGGLECLEFISSSQKFVETMFYTTVGIFAICYAWPRLNVNNECRRKVSVVHGSTVDSCVSRRMMLLVMSITFGVEIGFKLATRQLIWILNPCHLVTMMQVCPMMCIYFRL